VHNERHAINVQRDLLTVDRKSTGSALSDARNLLRKSGFAFIPGNAFLALDDIGNGFLRLAQAWSNLPADRYFTGSKPNRFRRHAQLDFDADTGEITPRENKGYFQPIEFNPLFGGMVRRFASIEEDLQDGNVLTSLVRLAAGQVFDLTGRWFINIHLVRIISDEEEAVPPAPEGPHRDGYDFISVHLVFRNNDSGGETLILDQADNEVCTLTLDAPMDTIYMDDRQFHHDVTPISAAGRRCHRDMILMSYQRPESTFSHHE
jgi:hypothetical protein